MTTPIQPNSLAGNQAEQKKLDQALIRACRHGKLGTAQMMLKIGANPNAQDNAGNTPLHWAVCSSSGRTKIVCLLLDHGAQPNAQGSYGQTPLHWAVFEKNVSITRLLLERGANPNAQAPKGGETPLHLAVRCVKGASNINIVRLLLDHGAKPNVQDNYGSTPLYWATFGNNASIARLLLERGANPNVQDKEGATVLHTAASLNHTDMVRLLLDHGARLDVQDKDGRTPLDLAQTPEIRALLQAHALDVRLRLEPPKDVPNSLDRPEMAL